MEAFEARCLAQAARDTPFVMLHHAVVIQIEGASYRLRQHVDLVPEHVRSKALITPPPAPGRSGRPPGKATLDHAAG